MYKRDPLEWDDLKYKHLLYVKNSPIRGGLSKNVQKMSIIELQLYLN